MEHRANTTAATELRTKLTSLETLQSILLYYSFDLFPAQQLVFLIRSLENDSVVLIDVLEEVWTFICVLRGWEVHIPVRD